MQIKLVQHPVGQGGLFSGHLSCGAEPLRWVYDCGSDQGHELAREISAVAAQGDIDLLFLSHLDSDHVSGLDRLLAQARVREVVLPYLDEAVLIASIARDAARGKLSGLFIEAASDLAGWFGSRGVDVVTFVSDDDGEGGGGGDGPFVPGEPDGGGEGIVRAKWTVEPQSLTTEEIDRDVDLAIDGGRAAVQLASANAAMITIASRRLLNWALIPYVHMPPKRLMHAFENALEAEFGSPLDKMAIVKSAKSSATRVRLRECYDSLWHDHNLISMTLYCGPMSPMPGNVRIFTGHHRLYSPRFSSGIGGWMLTGDAHLDRRRRRQRFLQHYTRFTPLAWVFMLPHHGSIHNHSMQILDAMPNLMVGYATSGKNTYGHPHRDVRDDVDAHRSAFFHRVSERRTTALIMQLDTD